MEKKIVKLTREKIDDLRVDCREIPIRHSSLLGVPSKPRMIRGNSADSEDFLREIAVNIGDGNWNAYEVGNGVKEGVDENRITFPVVFYLIMEERLTRAVEIGRGRPISYGPVDRKREFLFY